MEPRNRDTEFVIVDGMRIAYDVEIPATSGGIIRADVYLPMSEGKYPALISYDPYGKNLPFEQGYNSLYQAVKAASPETFVGTSGKYSGWEVPDPEKWIPEGYGIVRVDSRGVGRTPGIVDNFSLAETQDFYDAIEWIPTQEWSDGHVGSTGSSYLGMMQWFVAALKPPHLDAMYVSEAASDYYRDIAHHGGILNEFTKTWFATQFASVQHGRGENGIQNEFTGTWVSGPETLTAEELANNVGRDLYQAAAEAPLDNDAFYTDRTARYDEIEVPFVSVGSWGAHGIHLHGNIETFLRARSEEKWLTIVAGGGFVFFHGERGRNHQLRFFNHFLKGTGDWLDEPSVRLEVRNPDGTHSVRFANDFPLPETNWQTLNLDASTESLRHDAASTGQIEYHALGDGITFKTAPFEKDIEITGPIAADLFVSSTTSDADLFLALRLYDPEGNEVLFRGQPEPKTPLASGWLRVSHRAIDPGRSKPYQPYHPHKTTEQLEPGRVYEANVEIWPTSLRLPAGYSLGLGVFGKDFDHGQEPVIMAFGGGVVEMRGVGTFTHTDVRDRPSAIFDNRVTIHTGPDTPSRLILPLVDPL